jgi:hypothetical protein
MTYVRLTDGHNIHSSQVRQRQGASLGTIIRGAGERGKGIDGIRYFFAVSRRKYLSGKGLSASIGVHPRLKTGCWLPVGDLSTAKAQHLVFF